MCKLKKGENTMMYPWEKDVFDLFDEAMEYACESGVWVEDTDPEEEEE